jgi:transcriptional regulator with XRE-family HTH domain
MNIGNQIKKIREFFDLSQVNFARELGITQAHVSKIEHGLEKPSEQLLLALSWRYGIRKEWIVYGDGAMMLDIEVYLQYILELYGEEKFHKSTVYLRLQNEEAAMLSCKQEGLADEEFIEMIQYLKKLWSTGNRDLQGWLKIQFKNAFPKFEESQKKTIASQAASKGA